MRPIYFVVHGNYSWPPRRSPFLRASSLSAYMAYLPDWVIWFRPNLGVGREELFKGPVSSTHQYLTLWCAFACGWFTSYITLPLWYVMPKKRTYCTQYMMRNSYGLWAYPVSALIGSFRHLIWFGTNIWLGKERCNAAIEIGKDDGRQRSSKLPSCPQSKANLVPYRRIPLPSLSRAPWIRYHH